MATIRTAFVRRFGAAEADAIVAAADEHKNGIHDKPGSDPFRWAIVIAIGYQCMEVDGYREHHGITSPWADLKAWIKEHGDLASHDGDSDYLSVFAGTYNEYVGLEEPDRMTARYAVRYRRSVASSKTYRVTVTAANPTEARIKAQIADPWYQSSVEVKRLGEITEVVVEAPRG